MRLCVRLSGTGFMPTLWDNAGYRLSIAGGDVSLVGERLGDYSVTVRFLANRNASVTATVTHSSGAQSIEPIQSVAHTELPKPHVSGSQRKPELVQDYPQQVEASSHCDLPNVGWLRPEEAEIFRRAVKQEPFTCLRCRKTCCWDTLRCRSEGGFGHLVYPSLEKHKAAGFVLFQRKGDGVSFQMLGCDVLQLDAEAVAVKCEGLFVHPTIQSKEVRWWVSFNHQYLGLFEKILQSAQQS